MPQISSDLFNQISYHKYGSGNTIVLLHGFPEDGELWRQVYPALSARFTVIIPDLPGSGNSILPKGDLSIEQLATSVQIILEHEGIGKAAIAGHSMGGYVALAMAELYPQLVAGISMVHSTAEADDDAKKETRRKAIELIRKGGREAFIKQMIPNLFSPAYSQVNKQVIAEQIQRGMRLEADSLVGYYTAMMNRPVRVSTIAKAGYPVQWIVGKDDNVVPFHKALQQSYLADRDFVSLYDNCGHMSMLENPERLTADINEFVTYCYNDR
jgi:pimeloyl-ACP methyl ester carboxylesterase